MKKYIFQIVLILIIVILCSILFNREEETPKTITKIEYIKVVDTITKIVIKKEPKIVYIKDTTQEGAPEIKANQYQTTLKTKNADAELTILTTGRLLDVQGLITHSKEYRRTESVRFLQKSSLFLYGETSVLPALQRFELGLDFVIKNRLIIGASGSYNVRDQFGSVNIKLGFKL